MTKMRWDRLLMTAGFLALLYYGGNVLYTCSYQSFEQYSFDQQLKGRTPSIPGFASRLLGLGNAPAVRMPSESAEGENILQGAVLAPMAAPVDKGWTEERLRAFKAATPPLPQSVLGRLEIPSLDLSVMLLQGTDDRTLNRAVGHIEGTAFPGQSGNIGIAGHRDGFFRPLKDISQNAIITLTTLKGRFFYRVKAINIVTPTDVRLLAPTARPSVTLVTCYPFHFVGDAPKRYVVTAEIFKIQGATAIAAEYNETRLPSPKMHLP